MIRPWWMSSLCVRVTGEILRRVGNRRAG
jgi:hypothetical protein